jgi:hypothetical protein
VQFYPLAPPKIHLLGDTSENTIGDANHVEVGGEHQSTSTSKSSVTSGFLFKPIKYASLLSLTEVSSCYVASV